MKKKLLSVLVSALLVAMCASFVACGGCGGGKRLKITPANPEYDVGIGGDLSVTVSLGEGKITRLKDGDAVVDTAEYLVEGEKLTIYESYMLYLDLGKHVFTVTTDTNEGTFTVNVVNNIVTTFDETDKNYVYGSSDDLVIDADLSTAKIHSVKAGERKLTANDYSYDGTAHKFTIKNAFLQTLYGTTEFTVELSNNTAHTFRVISDCMFTVNFDDGYVPNFYNDNAGKVTTGWNGTNALHWTGNTGNIMLFHLGEHGFGMTLDFDAEKLYELSFKFKNNWSNESAKPEGFLNMAIDGRGEVFWVNYLTERCDGGCATIDNDGVWSVKIYFKGLTGKEFISMYSGYDPTRPNTKLFDLLFDDIVLNEVTVQEPFMADTEKTVSRGSNEGDVWFDGAFGLRNITSVKAGDKELDKSNYFTAISSVVLRKDYLNTLTADTTYTVTFEDSKSVQFTVKMGKSEPTTFDEEVDRGYRIGGADISFNINLRGFEIKDIKYTGTETVVPTSAYEVKDGKLIVKHTFLDTLVGENGFTITVDNAGWLEGTDQAGTHTFNITTNAVVNKRFEDLAVGTAVGGSNGNRLDGLNGFGCNGTSSIVAGFDGNAWQLANGNGGNFMRIKNSQAASDAGDAYLAQLTDGTLYNLSFDVKYVSAKGSSDGNGENVAFEMHLFTTESSYYTLNFDKNGVLTCTNQNVIITEKTGGVYNVSVRFAFNHEGSGNGDKAGVLGLEAIGWQSVWYTIQLDNVVMTEVPLDNTATYVYNSNKDVVYNVTFDSVSKIEVNGEALSSDLYSVADGKLTVKAAFAQTVAGSAELVATLSDNSTETFILESTLMASIDFESDFDDSVMVKAWGGSPNEVATSGIDGKTWRYGNKGGNFMAFVTNLKDTPYGENPGIRLALKDGETYRLCFDIKLESAKKDNQDYTEAFSFDLHGTGTHATMTFNGGTKALTSTNEHVKIVAGDNGVYHVEFTFVYSANGTGGCNGNLDGCGGCVHLGGGDSWNKGVDYVLLMDNIQMIYETQA